LSWRSIDHQALLLLHDESLAEHGGAPGLRDVGLFESALGRLINLAADGNKPDLRDLAASYGVGLAKDHSFAEGNKRLAFLAVGLFLALSAHRLVTTQLDTTLTMLDGAAGKLDEAGLAQWLRSRVQPGLRSLKRCRTAWKYWPLAPWAGCNDGLLGNSGGLWTRPST
jgi:death-on-curing protein